MTFIYPSSNSVFSQCFRSHYLLVFLFCSVIFLTVSCSVFSRGYFWWLLYSTDRNVNLLIYLSNYSYLAFPSMFVLDKTLCGHIRASEALSWKTNQFFLCVKLTEQSKNDFLIGKNLFEVHTVPMIVYLCKMNSYKSYRI